uniref:Rho guanine nucleotide exchange factor (GEF) 39 n=1 Tax=Neogobius melanostomus TaxID=47308 RepID=A0A8C6TSB3_9GOBI
MSFSPTSCSPQASTIQEQRERWDRKRTRTTKELVQTEQRYCQQLQLVTTYFVEILNAKGTLKPVASENIFSSIKHIYNVNQALLVHLENGYVGRGFEQFCPQLHHYSAYVDNIYNAHRTLRTQLKKSKAFRHFKKLQESRLEFRGQSLEELLELPVTRVQQYKHYLDDLAANTSPHHPEFQQLSRASEVVSELSARIEENARHHENQLQLQRVQRLMTNRRVRVNTPGRWYIREGWLKVVPPKGSEAKAQMFFLFSDMLLQTRRSSALSLSNTDRFEVHRVFPLDQCAVEKVFGHTRSQGGLLSLSFPKAKLLLMSSDQDDFNNWFNCFTSAVRSSSPLCPLYPLLF